MAVIDDKSREYLKDYFKNEMQDEVLVELVKGRENPETCEFSENLIKELAEIDPRIKVKVYDISSNGNDLNVMSTPTIWIGRDKGYKIEYMGAPLGMEAEAFIHTIVMASKQDSELGAEARELIKYIDKPTEIHVFVTPTCPYCPKAVELAHKIAIESKGMVKSVCVEAQENLDFSRKFRVSSVPQQVINQDMSSVTVGVQPETKFIKQVLQYGSTKYDEAIKAFEEAKAKKYKLVDNPDYPVVLTDDTFDEAVKKYPFLVVDCWAEWCAPCKMIAPIIEALAKEMQGKVVFGKLDTEENQGIPMRYGIHSIPTLLIFKNGELVNKIIGARSKRQLKQEIESMM